MTTSTQLSQPSAKPWNPRSNQLDAVQFLLEHACAGLLLKPGKGKTSATLAAIAFLKRRKLIGKVLIIAPVRVCYSVWPNEIKKWADFNHLTYAIAHGDTQEEALAADVDIVLINPEGLDWLLDTTKTKTQVGKGIKLTVAVNMKRWKKFNFDVLVIDELSKFKHYTTGRHKALVNILPTFSRRWGLTGSPAANGLIDLFGECYMLDMGHALGAYITHYRNEFFIPEKYGHSWTIMPGAKERIYDRISGLMLPGDYNLKDLPELLENNIFVELPEEVRAIYTKLEKDFISAVNSGLVTAMNAASASSKLRQIANGGVFLDKDKRDEFGLFLPKQKREWANLHSEKTKALRDLVEELQGSPLLVAYDFEHDLDRLRTAFKDGVFACDYNMKQFPKLERDWNEGKISLLFGHPQSIGHGLNLQENCQDLCWHSLTWNLELYEQFIDRVWREGNNRPHVTVHHLLAQNTLDELIYGRLQTKATTQQDLFNALKEWAKERA